MVKGNKFLNTGLSISLAIIGLVVLFSFVSGSWSSVRTAFNTLNNTDCVTNATATYCGDAYEGATPPAIPLRALITSDGVLPLVIMAIVVIGAIVGLFALLGKNKRR